MIRINLFPPPAARQEDPKRWDSLRCVIRGRDPSYVELARERSRGYHAKYRQDPNFVAKELVRQAKRLADPDHQRREVARQERRKQQASYHEQERKRSVDRYRNSTEHRSNVKHYHTVKRYGITPAQAEELLAAQGGKCACCDRSDPKHAKGWFIDHDHDTNKVRGILCAWCNARIGMLGDTSVSVTHWCALFVSYLVKAGS